MCLLTYAKKPTQKGCWSHSLLRQALSFPCPSGKCWWGPAVLEKGLGILGTVGEHPAASGREGDVGSGRVQVAAKVTVTRMSCMLQCQEQLSCVCGVGRLRLLGPV